MEKILQIVKSHTGGVIQGAAGSLIAAWLLHVFRRADRYSSGVLPVNAQGLPWWWFPATLLLGAFGGVLLLYECLNWYFKRRTARATVASRPPLAMQDLSGPHFWITDAAVYGPSGAAPAREAVIGLRLVSSCGRVAVRMTDEKNKCRLIVGFHSSGGDSWFDFHKGEVALTQLGEGELTPGRKKDIELAIRPTTAEIQAALDRALASANAQPINHRVRVSVVWRPLVARDHEELPLAGTDTPAWSSGLVGGASKR